MNEHRIRIGENLKKQRGVVIGAMPLNLTVIEKNGAPHRVRTRVDKGVIIGDDVDLGCHVVVNHGVERDTVIGDNVYVGHLSSIGHDAVIGDHTVISLHVCVCGEAEIGEWCYIAPQAVIHPGVKIGDYTMIGSGSVVDQDIPGHVIAYGAPCRPRRRNTWTPGRG